MLNAAADLAQWKSGVVSDGNSKCSGTRRKLNGDWNAKQLSHEIGNTGHPIRTVNPPVKQVREQEPAIEESFPLCMGVRLFDNHLHTAHRRNVGNSLRQFANLPLCISLLASIVTGTIPNGARGILGSISPDEKEPGPVKLP